MDNTITKPIQSQTVSKSKFHSIKHKGNPFSLHFQQAIGTNNRLIVSKHANERLQQRGIHIDDNRWNQIEKKIVEAKKLGINDSLVLLRDAALIVSAKNNTVITAMNRMEATTQIFSNINGTIVME